MSEAAAELLGYPVCFHLPFKVVIHDLDIKGALVSAFYLTPVLAGRGAVSRHVHKPQVGSAGCEEFLEILLVVSESVGIPADGRSRIGIRTGREAPEKAGMDSIPFRGGRPLKRQAWTAFRFAAMTALSTVFPNPQTFTNLVPSVPTFSVVIS